MGQRPAPEQITNEIHLFSEHIREYITVPSLKVDLSKLGVQRFQVDGHGFTVEVIDSVRDYIEMCEKIFDFELIKSFIGSKEKPFTPLFNAMHGVVGPYVRGIMVDIFGVPKELAINCEPKEDFGGHHPDPNLTYASDMVNIMKTHSIPNHPHYDFGAAFDGDGDRNMILGEDGLFVTPSDSVAILADNLSASMPYFNSAKGGHPIKGLARSMPTSMALDRVAKALNVPFFEVPTGWKFFGNLMDKGTLSLCGEESFGTGCDIIREKDGLWACLAWLSVLAQTKLPVSQIQMKHWTKYGRNFFARYDYENCDSESCHKMMEQYEKVITDPGFVGKTIAAKKVTLSDNFSYKDMTDGTITARQGLRVIFDDGSRIILRLSGTGSTGATVRLYVESYVNDKSKYHVDAQEALKPLVQAALELSQLKQFTGRDKPDVIT
ncbi:phosphoglucomutase-1-like isoform X2 [Gordionus sp. m RMFG-2023]|uniref:phosphoglucomutase-1-like isoform X2 n=1 Tax=Gordionus sp. m RMFG-2023 TaxID=3053472 RepID=UPI0031FDAAE5